MKLPAFLKKIINSALGHRLISRLKGRPLVVLTVISTVLAAFYSTFHFLTPPKFRPAVKKSDVLDKINVFKKNRLLGTGLDLLLVLGILSYSLWHVFGVRGAAACPVTDGGAGDADATANGTIVIGANTTWTAEAAHLGVIDCTGVDIEVSSGFTLTFNMANDGDTDYTDDYGLTLLTDNLTVEGTISADGKGYNSTLGPGAGGSNTGTNRGGAGGGYGGQGANGDGSTAGSTYDNTYQSFRLGSGGGNGQFNGIDPGMPGGGAIKLEVSNTLEVNGSVSANGSSKGTGRAGGGSGGSIWIDTQSFIGSGTISAVGGGGGTTDSDGGAGGGGRISLHSNTNSFTGSISSIGGQVPASRVGAPGTLYLFENNSSTLTLNQTQTWSPDTSTDFENWFSNLEILNITNNITLTLIGGNRDSSVDGYGWHLIAENVNIATGSAITTDNYGHINATGEGAGGSNTSLNRGGAGGSYGGLGANGDGSSATTTYGSISRPLDLGSGGGNGQFNGTDIGAYGGGAVKISAIEKFENWGIISSDGQDNGAGRAGGGSGGSVWIFARELIGNGEITALGGSGGTTDSDGGAGGGGRVSLQYWGANNYTGSVSVIGGQAPATRTGGEGSSNLEQISQGVSNLAQYESNGTTVVETGASSGDNSVLLKMLMWLDSATTTFTPEVELRPLNESFTNTPTHTGQAYTNPNYPIEGQVAINNLSDAGSFHWQARLCDDQDSCTSWVSYGENTESEADFSILRTVLYLPFDEQNGQSTFDKSGNENNGTIGITSSSESQDPTWKTQNDCKYNGCISLDGTDDVVTVTNTSDIDLNGSLADELAIIAWIYPTGAGEGTGGQVFWKGANNYLSVSNLSNGKLDLTGSLDLATSDATVTAPAAITMNEWNYVAMTYTDDTDDEITLWVNSNQVAVSTNGSGAPAAESNNLLIGGTTTNNFEGFVDEFRIHANEPDSNKLSIEMNLGTINFGAGNRDDDDIVDGAGNPPVAHWNFDAGSGTTLADISGNDNNGTLGGDGIGTDLPTWTDVLQPPSFVNGLGGKALEFDGVDDYVNIATNPTTQTNNITIEAWIFWQGNTGHVVDIGGSGGYGLHINNSGLVTAWVDGVSINNSSVSVTQNAWQHVTLVRRSGSWEAYLNGGEQKDIGFSTAAPNAVNGNTRIGVLEQGSHDFNGIIDDVKIYDYARTPAQIAYDYNRGAPVAWWKMDDDVSGDGTDNIKDASGNNNHGDSVDGAGTGMDCTVEGKRNLGCNFDGTDDFIQITDSPELRPGTQPWSISAWVNAPDSDQVGVIIGKRSTSSPFNQMQISVGSIQGAGTYTSSKKISIVIRADSSNNWWYRTQDDVVDGNWHHINFVRPETGDSYLYIDGKLAQLESVADNNTEPNNINNSADWLIGKSSDNINYFNGTIDEVRIYNYALSPAQIAKVMNEGSVRFGPAEGSP